MNFFIFLFFFQTVHSKIAAGVAQCPEDSSSPSSWIEYRLYAGLLAELLHSSASTSFMSYLKESVGIDGVLALLKHLSQPYLPSKKK